MRRVGLSPDDLDGVLVTHGHIDHISGIKMLLKHHAVPVFTSRGAGYGIVAAIPESDVLMNCFDIGTEFDLGGIVIRSFNTPHDSSGSVGFTLAAGGSKLAYVTDLGYVTRAVAEAARGADIAIIEANHDRDMLKYGSYPYRLKMRIMSEYGHLSNNDSGTLAAHLAATGTRHILLAHLSRENNTPLLARTAVTNALYAEGITIGHDVEVDVAPHDMVSRVYDVGG